MNQVTWSIQLSKGGVLQIHLNANLYYKFKWIVNKSTRQQQQLHFQREKLKFSQGTKITETFKHMMI
jgi:hypothetical protein